MIVRVFFVLMLVFCQQIVVACTVCEKQQPKITFGLTHGAGPQSNWDWVIIAIVTLITIFTLIYSIKFLIKPGEKESSHIKQSILNN